MLNKPESATKELSTSTIKNQSGMKNTMTKMNDTLERTES